MASYPEWIYRQSAVLPFRERAEGLEVLLITSRSGKRWVLPKGIVEPGLTPPASAAKEAREEAGIEGEVWDRSLGRYRYDKWGGTCQVDVFPMRVTAELEDWPEASFRRRKWLTLKKAAKRIDEGKLRKLVRRLPKAVGTSAGAKRPPGAGTVARPRLIYLFRHAKSSWDDPALEDIERPLAPRGRHACEVMRDYMRLADVEPDLILCSSSVRTRQTLEAVLPVMREGVKVRHDRGIYHGGAVALGNRLRRVPDEAGSVMMIGHNPAMQELAVSLTGTGDAEALARLATKFPTGALATLVLQRDHWQELKAGSCELHSLVVPRELA